MDPLGLYVHVPFCAYRCAYCDFAIVTGQERRVPDYLDACERELTGAAERFGGRTVDTVYFGGGTPSRLPAPDVARILTAIRARFAVLADAEVSFEANPDDVTPGAVDGWLAAGVTRLTIGVQSLTAAGHAALGRPGSVEESRRALETARSAGVPTIGADVIFGRPGQTLAEWLDELDAVRELDVDHLSLYALETTGQTPLVRAVRRGVRAAPDPDVAADMYEAAIEAVGASGFEQYEISNFARPGHMSRHNLRYWRDAPYLGLGQAAASYVDGARWTNPRRFSDYVASAGSCFPLTPAAPYDPDVRAGEALMFGLRKTAGVDTAEVERRHGVEAVRRREPVLRRAAERGLATRSGSIVRFTPRGMLLADEVFVDLL